MGQELRLMEERELATLRRQVEKMEAEAAAAEAERARKAAEEAAWSPAGVVEWSLRVEALDEGGLGGRVGVVHSSVVHASRAPM
jgi:hypothetical protein